MSMITTIANFIKAIEIARDTRENFNDDYITAFTQTLPAPFHSLKITKRGAWLCMFITNSDTGQQDVFCGIDMESGRIYSKADFSVVYVRQDSKVPNPFAGITALGSVKEYKDLPKMMTMYEALATA